MPRALLTFSHSAVNGVGVERRSDRRGKLSAVDQRRGVSIYTLLLSNGWRDCGDAGGSRSRGVNGQQLPHSGRAQRAGRPGARSARALPSAASAVDAVACRCEWRCSWRRWRGRGVVLDACNNAFQQALQLRKALVERGHVRHFAACRSGRALCVGGPWTSVARTRPSSTPAVEAVACWCSILNARHGVLKQALELREVIGNVT